MPRLMTSLFRSAENPDATRFAEQELPKLSLHVINALLALALEGAHAPDSDHEGLATFFARAKGFSVGASATSENAGATPPPDSIPLGELLPATPAESSPFDGRWSEEAVESYQKTHAGQDAAVGQGEPEEDIVMEDDLGGEEPMFFMDQAGQLDEDSSAMAATTPPTSTLDSSSPFHPQSPAADDQTAPEPPRPQASLSSVLPTLRSRKISRIRTIASDKEGDRVEVGSEECERPEAGERPETDSAASNKDGSAAAEGVARAPPERVVNPKPAGEAENLREIVRPPNPNPPFSPTSRSAAPPLAAAPNAETVGVAYSPAKSLSRPTPQAFPSATETTSGANAHAAPVTALTAVASTSSLSAAPALPASTRPARWRLPAGESFSIHRLLSSPPHHPNFAARKRLSCFLVGVRSIPALASSVYHPSTYSRQRCPSCSTLRRRTVIRRRSHRSRNPARTARAWPSDQHPWRRWLQKYQHPSGGA